MLSANCRPKYYGRSKHCVFRHVAQNASRKLVWLLSSGDKLSFEMPKNSCLLEVVNVKLHNPFFVIERYFATYALTQTCSDTFEILFRVNNLSWYKFILRPRFRRSFAMTNYVPFKHKPCGQWRHNHLKYFPVAVRTIPKTTCLFALLSPWQAFDFSSQELVSQ